jgi:hypothetical protein
LDWIKEGVKGGTGYAYDWNERKFHLDNTSFIHGLAMSALYLGLFVPMLLIQPLGALALPLIALGYLVAFVLGPLLGYVIFAYGLKREGLECRPLTFATLVDYTVFNAWYIVNVFLSLKFKPGFAVIVLAIVASGLNFALLLGSIAIGATAGPQGAMLAGVQVLSQIASMLLFLPAFLVIYYNAARLMFAPFHYLSNPKMGKRQAIDEWWTRMGGVTLDAFIALFATQLVLQVMHWPAIFLLAVFTFFLGGLGALAAYGFVMISVFYGMIRLYRVIEDATRP